MTDTLIETLWIQFGLETREHLERIETLLVDAETDSLQPGGIAELFRAFHSIKGTSKAMDILAMQAVAHKAEDVLELVRSGLIELDDQLIPLLLDAADALKTLLSEVLSTRQDTAPPKDVLERLHTTHTRLTQTHKQQHPREPVAPSETNPAPAADEPDSEMLRFFIEHVREQLPKLVTACRARYGGTPVADLPPLLEGLEYAATVMNFTELATRFAGLRQLLDQSEPLTDHHKEAGLTHLRELGIQLKQLESLSGLSADTGLLDAWLGEITPVSTPDKPATDPGQYIRVPTETLDLFMNEIGELALAISRFEHARRNDPVAELIASLTPDLQDRQPRMAEIRRQLEAASSEQRDHYSDAGRRLRESLIRLQENALALRVVPMETVFKRFPRPVRDLAHAKNKKVRLVFQGREVRIDKTMIEILTDPLMHMLRNSVDHGIETREERLRLNKPEEALITLKARQQGNRIIVQISDDGQGIDTHRVLTKAMEQGLVTAADSHGLSEEQILQFIFAPGFSTASQVSETSGRGVGMDVVRTNIDQLGGTIVVKSEAGKGCVFTIQLPLSAALQEVLEVETGREVLAIPKRQIEESISVNETEVHRVNGHSALLWKGAFLPLIRLDAILRLPHSEANIPDPDRHAVIVVAESGRMALEVDRIRGYSDLFVKDVHPCITAIPAIGGAALLGNGRVVLIVDVDDLFELVS